MMDNPADERTIRIKPYIRDESHTYSQQLADFVTAGKWTLTNYFTFVIEAILNGTPVGYIEGSPTGENFGYCIICGTPIVHHYTVTEFNSRRSVNVGCECIEKIFKDRGDLIAKALKSLQAKTKSHYLRPFKHQVLTDWLQKIAATDADECRGSQIISEIIAYGEMTLMEHATRTAERIEKIKDPQEKEKAMADAQKTVATWDANFIEPVLVAALEPTNREGRFNYWHYHAQTFPIKDWNPDNMRSQYKGEATHYDSELPPSWNVIKLTDDQKKEMNKLIITKTNKYIADLNKKMGCY